MLEASDLCDFLLKGEEKPVAAGDAQDKWVTSNHKIFARLVQYTEDAPYDMVTQFVEERDGMKAWKGLVAKYELKGNVQKAVLQKELHNVAMAEGDDPDVFFGKLETIRRQLKNLKVEVDESSMIGAVMGNLPFSYESLLSVVEGDEDLSYEDLKKRIRVFHLRHARSAKGEESALMTTFDGKCHGCGAYGHKKSDCPRRTDKGSSGSRDGGGGGGHAGRGGGGGKKIKCHHCNKLGHIKKDCWLLKKERKEEAAHAATGHCLALTAMDNSRDFKGKRPFIMDSGASSHYVESASGLTNVRSTPGDVTIADGKKMASTGTGQMELVTTDINGRRLVVTLSDVIIVPGLNRRLLSASRIIDKGGRVVIDSSGGFIEVQGRKIPIHKSGQLYEVDLHQESDQHAVETAHIAVGSEVWHARLGHRNAEDIRKLGELGLGVPNVLTMGDKCDVCELSKHTHASFPRPVEHRVNGPLDMVHTDVIGPMGKESLGGAKSSVIFVDAFSRWVVTHPVKAKSQALEALKAYDADMSGLLGGRRIKSTRSDNGGEFTSARFKQWCKLRGINQTFTGPHSPQQNGLCERAGRTVVEMTRCLLSQSGLGKEFWAEAMSTATYIINRLPTTTLDGDTPHHVLLGKHARLDHLRVFGCQAYVHVYDGHRKKLDAKAWRGILVGYDPQNTRCYRVYDPTNGKMQRSVHVTFEETRFPAKSGASLDDESGDDEVELEPQQESKESVGDTDAGGDGAENGDAPDDGNAREEKVESTTTDPEEDAAGSVGAPVWKWSAGIESQADTLGRVLVDGRSMSRRAAAKQQQAHRVVHHAYAAAESTTGDPSSYKDALESADAIKWQQAMKEEYDALESNGTWTLCELPSGANVIGSRWVFKTKLNELGQVVRHKARLVAQGYSQVPGQDYFDTYAPVAKLSSIRTILAIAAIKDWEVHQMDVDTAFLQSPVDEEIYVCQPQGYERYGPGGTELVCRVHKSLYGLKQSPRNWNRVLDEWLRSYGLEPSTADPCIYVKIEANGNILLVGIYVDDALILGNIYDIVNEFKVAISSRFKMKDLGNLHWLLGMEIRRNRELRTIEIHQTAYIDRMLERFGMSDCKPVATPVEGVLSRLSDDHKGKPDGDYMSLVGSLLYAAMVTRPDIAYAVQALGRHLQASGPDHWTAAKRVLRYLKGTRELGIKYGMDGADQVELHGYCDSDWAGDIDSRRSTTAYVFVMAGGSVSWASKLQPTVALSSSEAEYMAACAAVQEAIYMRRLLGDLGFHLSGPTAIHADNQSCIAMGKNPVHHKRSKHIDIRYHFTRERVESGEVELKYVPTEHQLADLLTKPLRGYRTATLRERVLGYMVE